MSGEAERKRAAEYVLQLRAEQRKQHEAHEASFTRAGPIVGGRKVSTMEILQHLAVATHHRHRIRLVPARRAACARAGRGRRMQRTSTAIRGRPTPRRQPNSRSPHSRLRRQRRRVTTRRLRRLSINRRAEFSGVGGHPHAGERCNLRQRNRRQGREAYKVSG